jgi:cytoskeletal protein CcmA (bactofilin family)
VLEELRVRPEDRVAMVGHFEPLVEGLRRRARSLTVFERLSAPLIRTGHSDIAAPPLLTGRQPYDLPKSAMELDEHTSLVNGTIVVPERSAITRNLIASDSVEIGSQCLVDGSLKGHRLVSLAAGCIVRGAIVSGRDIEIGPDCIIAGPLIAEGRITIASGCVIGTRALETSISAPHITLAPGSRFSGTIWATKHGRVS